MSQTVTATRVGVNGTEHVQNAAIHGPHDRSATKGVAVSEAVADAVLNTQTANE